MASIVNRVLWWTLVVSLLIYAVVAHVASPGIHHNTQADVPMLFAVFAGLSVAVGIGTLVYRRRALVLPIRDGRLDPTKPEELQRAFQPFILNLVLSESVGIYGLVLAFLSGNGSYSLPFILGALGLMYLHRPTAPDLVPPISGRQAWKNPSPLW